jgi:hypothetical protein
MAAESDQRPSPESTSPHMEFRISQSSCGRTCSKTRVPPWARYLDFLRPSAYLLVSVKIESFRTRADLNMNPNHSNHDNPFSR